MRPMMYLTSTSLFSPLFNAGKGAVFTKGGKVECEASVMLTPPLHPRDTACGLPGLVHGNDWFERGCPSEEMPGQPPESEKAALLGLDPDISNGQGFDTHAIPSSRRGAAVTLVSQTKNPILLARTLYLLPSEAPHVHLSGSDAEQIGWSRGTIKVNPSYYWTRKRWLEHRRGLGLPDDDAEHDVPPPYPVDQGGAEASQHPDQKIFEQYKDYIDDRRPQGEFLELPKGTVGACAIDAEGRLAVATSTGGKTNKNDGRVGDTPTIGAGFWAERFVPETRTQRQDVNHETDPPGCFSSLVAFMGGKTQNPPLHREKVLSSSTANMLVPSAALALSGTGDGDYFLRVSFASLVAHRMRFLGEPAEVAGQKAVDELGALNGESRSYFFNPSISLYQ